MKTQILDLPRGKIAYWDSQGDGPAVVLVHGNSLSRRVFCRQFEGELARRLRLVAFDLPGHGDSEPPTPTSLYGIDGPSGVLVEVLRSLQLEDAVVVGFSLGGHIALRAADRLNRVPGLMIFGTPPLATLADLGKAFKDGLAYGFQGELSVEEAQAWAQSFLAPGSGVDLTPFVDQILATNPEAREGLAQEAQSGEFINEVERIQEFGRPLAVLLGEHEQLIFPGYVEGLELPTLWRGRVQRVPGAGHALHYEEPERFAALLEAFVDEVGAGASAPSGRPVP